VKLQIFVTEHFAGDFLDLAFDFLGGALEVLFVHDKISILFAYRLKLVMEIGGWL
jgi:hypothetical protein